MPDDGGDGGDDGEAYDSDDDGGGCFNGRIGGPLSWV
jgi:hypothetical protein